MPLAEPMYLSTQGDADDVEPDVPDVDDIGDDITPPDEGAGGDGNDDDGDGEPLRWVTIAKFSDPTAAHLARMRLESEQIDCMLLGETLVATVGIYANGAGGVH